MPIWAVRVSAKCGGSSKRRCQVEKAQMNRFIVGYLDRLPLDKVRAVCVPCTEAGKAHSPGKPIHKWTGRNWHEGCHVCKEPLVVDRLKVFEEFLDTLEV
jgi:hypothetical protein